MVESSRIIVKNIPKYVTKNRLEAHFAVKGSITDVKMIMDPDGKFRRFAFIGFKNSAEASAAVEYFNNTYMDTLKLTVELAKPTCDPNLERPWSKYSKGSSAYDKINGTDTRIKETQPVKEKIELPKTLIDELLEEEEKRDSLKAYIDVLQPKSKKRTWENEEDHENQLSLKKVDNAEDSDDEYQTLPIFEDKEKPLDIPTEQQSEEEIEDDFKIIQSTSRLYIVNLPYSATEDEIIDFFQEFGEIKAFNIPKMKSSSMIKGIAFITYKNSQDALKLFKEHPNLIFQGRVLKISAGLEEKQSVETVAKTFKEQRELDRKAAAGDSKSWNTFFIAPNAVADAIASNLGMSKSDILDRESGNMAVRLALAETHVITELKNFFDGHQVDLESFQFRDLNRSKTIIVVKNLPANTKPSEITDLFAPFGELGRVLIPPKYSVTALVEMQSQSDAKKAFKQLAYRKFKNLPLYLEWAPANCFKIPFDPEKHCNTIINEEAEPQEPRKRGADYLLDATDETAMDPDAIENTKLIARNVSFDASLRDLKQLFGNYSEIKAVRLPKKITGGHRGFCFLEFYTAKGARDALTALKHTHLYGRRLVLEYARAGETLEELRARTKVIDSKKPKKVKLDEGDLQ